MSSDSPNVVEIKTWRQEARDIRIDPREAPLQGGGGGGTSDGMEARVAKVEAAIEHIQQDISEIKGDVRSLRDYARTDFRVMFGAIIAVALGLAGLMAKGFHWL
jgi:hypothetical protein